MRSLIYVAATLAVAACGGGKKSAPSTPAPTASTPSTSEAPATPPAMPVPAPVAPPTGHPSNDLIPRTVFFGNPDKVSVQISPDGKYLSWIAAKDGVLNVWVAPVDQLDQARAITADTTRPVREYHWTFDKKHLLYMQDKGGDENFHIYRVDVTAPGDAVDLTPLPGARAELMGLSHTRPSTILVGLNDRDPKYHDAYEIDLTSGDRKKVLENAHYAGFIADRDLHLRLAIDAQPDGGQIISQLDPAKGKKPFTLAIPGDDSLTTQANGLDKSGTTLYLTDSRGRDTGALFKVDIRTGKQRLVAEDAHSDVVSIVTHPTEETLQAVKFNYQKATWTVLDKSVKGDFDALAKVAPGDFDVNTRTLDDKTWLVVFHSDVNPASYYRWDRKSKKATFLFNARPDLEKYTLAHVTPAIVKARDGLELVTYVTLPPGADPDGDGKPTAAIPTVLLVHGGPWARDVWGFSGITQLLANRGYAVVQVNFRGSNGFGKKYVNAGNGEWGKKMHDDLLDTVDWAVAQGISPKDKVCIMGGSYGGYATLVGVAMTPDEFACGVDIVGPSNLLTLMSTIPPYWASFVATMKARVGDWDSDEGKTALTAVSPLTHAAAIKVPLLIGQGANDPRVHQAEADQIVKAMQAKSIPVTYVLFPDEGHGFARPENNLAFFAVAEAFLSAHLGGLYQPMSKDDFKGSTMKIVAGKDGVPGLPGDL